MRIIDIHNCGDGVVLNELPDVTPRDIYDTIDKAYIKIASLDLTRMKPDNYQAPSPPPSGDRRRLLGSKSWPATPFLACRRGPLPDRTDLAAMGQGMRMQKVPSLKKMMRDIDAFMKKTPPGGTTTDSDSRERTNIRISRDLLGSETLEDPWNNPTKLKFYDGYVPTTATRPENNTYDYRDIQKFGPRMSRYGYPGYRFYGPGVVMQTPLTEYTECYVGESSEDDELFDDAADDDGGDEQLVAVKRFYTRDLLAFCQDEESVHDFPDQCCAEGTEGELCLYISRESGYVTTPYEDREKIYAPLVVERARACEFGYCTDGNKHQTMPSPPPPPPFKQPPRPVTPNMPGFPELPPGADYDEDDLVDNDYDYFFKSPPPNPPPAAPPPAQYADHSGKCGPARLTKPSNEELLSMSAYCPDQKRDLLVGWQYDMVYCNASAKDSYSKAGFGGASVARCYRAKDRMQVDADCHEIRSPYIKMQGEWLSDSLIGTNLKCPDGYAMSGWRTEMDKRPWYIREREPGRYKLAATCCPVPMTMCETRHGVCGMPTTGHGNSSFRSLVLDDQGVVCAHEEHTTAVMTSWKFTTTGCEGTGKMRLEAICCTTPHQYTTDHIEETEASALLVQQDVNPQTVQAESALVSDFAAADAARAGPLLDSMIVQQGASRVPREKLRAPENDAPHAAGHLEGSWAARAYEAINPASKDSHAGRFCHEGVSDDLSDLGALLKPCSEAKTARAGETVPYIPAHSGNVFLKASAHLSVAFSAVWSFRVESRAFTGALSLDLVRASNATKIASKSLQRYRRDVMAATIETFLEAGVYELTAHLAYDADGDYAASTGANGRNDALLFRQESKCGVYAWMPLSERALDACGGGEDLSSDGDVEEPKGPLVKLDDTDEKKCAKKKVESGKLTGKNKGDFDGAFISLKVGGSLEDILHDNYFIFQGKFILLMFRLDIDISVIPGSKEAGGGIYMWFYFLWGVGNLKLAELEGHLDVVPLDFEKLISGDFSALTEIEISLGVSIKPHIFNHAMVIVDYVLKVLLSIIFLPIVLAIVIAQELLDLLIPPLEAAQSAVQAAQQSLNQFERSVSRELNRYEAKEDEYVRAERSYYFTQMLVDDPGLCQRMQTTKREGQDCIEFDGQKECKVNIQPGHELPQNCGSFIAFSKRKMDQWWGSCCKFFKRLSRFFLQVLIKVTKFLVFLLLAIPRLVLLIVEAILFIALAAFKFAKLALQLAVEGFASALNGEVMLDKNNRLKIKRFYKWLWKVEILRIWEMAIGMEYSLAAISFEAMIDLTIFGNHIMFELRFSFDFKEMVKAFIDWVKSMFTRLSASQASQCIEGDFGCDCYEGVICVKGDDGCECETVVNCDECNEERAECLEELETCEADCDSGCLDSNNDKCLENCYADCECTECTKDNGQCVDQEVCSEKGPCVESSDDPTCQCTEDPITLSRECTIKTCKLKEECDEGDEVEDETMVCACQDPENLFDGQERKCFIVYKTGPPPPPPTPSPHPPPYPPAWLEAGAATSASARARVGEGSIAVTPAPSVTKSAARRTAELHEQAHTVSQKRAAVAARELYFMQHHAAFVAPRKTRLLNDVVHSTSNLGIGPNLSSLSGALREAATGELHDGEDSEVNQHLRVEHERHIATLAAAESMREAADALAAARALKSPPTFLSHRMLLSRSQTHSAEKKSAVTAWADARSSIAKKLGVRRKVFDAIMSRSEGNAEAWNKACGGGDRGTIFASTSASASALRSSDLGADAHRHERRQVGDSRACVAAATAASMACPVAAATRAADSRPSTRDDKGRMAALTCAMALNTATSRRCRAEAATYELSRSCATTFSGRDAGSTSLFAAAVGCSSACTASLGRMADTCGSFVPRGEIDSSDGTGDVQRGRDADCVDARHEAQRTCGGEGESASSSSFCAELMEAMPEAARVDVRAAEKRRRKPIHLMHWEDQGIHGIVPRGLLCSAGLRAHVDLRGNNLVGSVPECAWAGRSGSPNLFLSRNMLTGTIGVIGANHRHVHLAGNLLTGNLGDALRTASGLNTLDVSRNNITGSLTVLSNHRWLSVLDVGGNRLSDGDTPVSATLGSMTNLKRFDLTGNDFDISRAPPRQVGQISLPARNKFAQFGPSNHA